MGKSCLYMFYTQNFNKLILFLSFSNPTPFGKDDDVLQGVKWTPLNSTDSGNVPFINIDKNLEIKLNPDNERLSFWDRIYEKFNGINDV